MAAAFDPYHKWLGIGPAEQPPHHYRLLGIPPLEDDPDVIESAADRQMAHLRTFQTGRHVAECQQLLNEVAKAKTCLMGRQKAAYDQALREKLASATAADQKEAVSADVIGLGDEDRKASRSTVLQKSGVQKGVPVAGGSSGKLYIGIAAAAVILTAVAGLLLRGGKQDQTAPLERRSESQQANAEPSKPDAPAAPPSARPPATSAPPSSPARSEDRADSAPPKPEHASSFIPPPSSFPNAPPLAIAPFDAQQAKNHQEAWAKYLGVPVEMTNSIGMKFVLIPPGEFEMGASEETLQRWLADLHSRYDIDKVKSAGPQHHVRLTHPFYFATCELTRRQYGAVTANSTNGAPVADADSDLPLAGARWEDATVFCSALTELRPEKQRGCVYRLPSEAEWEYACRAGAATAYCFGDDSHTLADYAWIGPPRPQPGGRKKANSWGLFDMHGNVSEWCADFYSADYYRRSPIEDPRGPESGTARVWRGGSIRNTHRGCAGNSRHFEAPNRAAENVGFRIVCGISSRAAVAGMATDAARPVAPTDARPIATAPSEAASTQPAAPPADRPVAPGSAGGPASPAAASTDGRLPEPDTAAQQKAQKIVAETYQEAFQKAKTNEEKAAVAKRMVEQAVGAGDDAAGRFVLLRIARDVAAGAGDAETAMTAIDQLSAAYQVNPSQMRLDALSASSKKTRSPAARKAIAERALSAVDEAVLKGAFTEARDLGKLAAGDASKARDKELVQQVRARIKDLEDAEKAYAKVTEALAVLKDKPNDPDANLAVGRYLCFTLGDWERGLAMLAKGSDEKLRDQAEKELQRPGTAAAQIALADGWCELAGKSAPAMRKRLETRAAHWYFEALPALKGVLRSKVETRLDGLHYASSGLPTKRINKIDGSELVLVPAGKFLAGGPKPEEGGGTFSVCLPAYYLGLCEVTNGQYKKFIDATGHRPPDHSHLVPPLWRDRECAPDKADWPVVCVTWTDAVDYCKWAGLRLPTELEWEKGARGADGRPYPWGAVWDPAKCRNKANAGNELMCPVQTYPEGRSPWGLYQMLGNVQEWCVEYWEAGAYTRYRSGDFSPPLATNDNDSRAVRGGKSSSDKPYCAARFGSWRHETKWGGSGFRVAKDAK